MEIDLFGEKIKESFTLADKYLLAPTSVLNKRSPKWADLKRRWIKLGIKSELGRDVAETIVNKYDYNANFKFGTKAVGKSHYTSIFDPVICEIIYKWFCPNKGFILDPFAGGSVRGIVANYLGYKYTGIELREDQCKANRDQAIDILDINNQPQWYCGDSDEVLKDKFLINYDLVFSCPPYMNLEKYSNLENDLSNMNDDKFVTKYSSIIKKSCDLIKKGGYAVFVVGDVRDTKGYYKDFTGITKKAFLNCGMKLYNELILIDPVGTKALTMERSFKSRKLAKVHQTIYIFHKLK